MEPVDPVRNEDARAVRAHGKRGRPSLPQFAKPASLAARGCQRVHLAVARRGKEARAVRRQNARHFHGATVLAQAATPLQVARSGRGRMELSIGGREEQAGAIRTHAEAPVTGRRPAWGPPRPVLSATDRGQRVDTTVASPEDGARAVRREAERPVLGCHFPESVRPPSLSGRCGDGQQLAGRSGNEEARAVGAQCEAPQSGPAARCCQQAGA
mmetsp:Transcript_114169/g.355523  ORF Transcript_114169/g.355523 Transcript_114169/m.355523 type:complete len:213 (-) Transcript_114169:61-699(-)